MSRAGLMEAAVRQRRGALLFEVLLSLALFIGAASFAIGVTRNTLRAIDRSHREMQAIDLARAKMAELEAGLVSVTELREGERALEQIGSMDWRSMDGAYDEGGWELDVSTERTEFTGLTLVELTVTEVGEGRGEDDAGLVSATLRQLVKLREETEEEYETDELLRGLETESEGR